jgi:hypothetical protein
MFAATEWATRSPLLLYPVIALVIFVIVFGGILARTLLAKSARFDRAASLPLEETDHE